MFHGVGAQARSWGGQPAYLNRWRWHKKSADRGSREISPKEFQRLAEKVQVLISLVSCGDEVAGELHKLPI